MESIVTIEKIINNGMGLARPADSKIIMVPGVLPKEVVRVSLVKEFRGYIEAQLEEIISASPERIEPACRWYKDCGGCDLQHSAYETQLEIKTDILQETIARAGISSDNDFPVSAISSPDQFHYRYRIRLKINQIGEIGFYRKKTNALVPVNSCAIATEKLNAALTFLQESPELKNILKNYKELELLHSPADDKVSLLLLADQKNSVDLTLLAPLTDCSEIDQAAFLVKGKIKSSTMEPLNQHFTVDSEHNQHKKYSLSWGANCFSQVNTRQNEQLVQLICKLVGNIQERSVLDLYCGMGNFSIPLALCGAAVTGIELNPESIKWARFNAKTNGVICNFYAADVTSSLKNLASEQQKIDTIVLDPPRMGLGKGTHYLTKLQARKILYISCDPATLSRDLAILLNHGFSLKQLIPVDMFPQTHHIESVALLKRN